MAEVADASSQQYDSGPQGGLEESSVGVPSADVLDLNPDELVSYVASHDFDSLRFLWTLDDNVRSVFTDAHILRVSGEIGALSEHYDGTNTENIRELLLFVRVAHYHGYFNSDLDVTGTRSGIVEDFQTLSSSPHLNDLNTEASQIIHQWILAVDAVEIWTDFIGTYKQVLSDYSNDPLRQQAENAEQAGTVFSVMVALQRTAHPSYNPQAFFDQELLNLLTPYTIPSNHQPHADYLVDNAIWTIGNFARVDGFQDDAVSILTDVMDSNPSSSSTYLWAVKSLDLYGDGQNSRGEAVSMDTHRDAADELLFPNSFSFDDGSLVIQTPLEFADAQAMFDAVQDVKAQFQIIADTTTPVPGDSNDVLTAVVYGSIEDYKDYQPVLNNLSTNNGGIYIEQDGTFYTYERTPDESRFTLEELFRHEYVHYLTGRFVIEGMWGGADIYSNNRMVWFDEGFAEFLAGSTADGVIPRATNIISIENDGADRLTIQEVVNSAYGDGFKFYRYGGAFFNFLHDNHTDRLNDLLSYARNSDITSFDLWVDEVQSDVILEEEYQEYLDARIDDLTYISITSADADRMEGDLESTPFTFTVTRSGNSSEAMSVEFAVAGTTANPADAADFLGNVLPTGTVSFSAGQTSQQVTVNVGGDNVAEPDEQFVVTLANPSIGSARYSSQSAIGTIRNSDPWLFTVDTNTDISDGDFSSGNLSLREAIDLATANSSHDTILFDASLSGQTITLGGTPLTIGSDLTIAGLGAEQLTISGNDASRVFSILTGVNAEMSGLTITGGNAGASSGGGINNRGTLTISGSTISGNTAGFRGGGVYSDGSSSALTIIDSTISANATVGENGQGGGGIKFYGSTVTITNSTLSGNTAVRAGGGISNSGGDLTIIGSTLANNSANETGGGIQLISEAVATITNSTLSGNTGYRGGAIGIRLGGSLRLVNSTLTGNSADSTGGGIHNGGATTPVELTNTIVANNHNAGSSSTPNISGEFTSHGNNLVGFDGSATGFTNGENGDLVGTSDAPIDPLLGPLANNGGQTRTHALLEGSPAIDAGHDSLAVDPSGNPLGTDQRGSGFDRNVSGSVDIGAFEVAVVPETSIIDATFDAATGTLEITATEAAELGISSVAGTVQVTVDGSVDSSLGTLLTSTIEAIVVTGSSGDDVIDLSGVTPVEFDGLGGTTPIRVSAGAGDDIIIGSPFDDKFNGQAGNDQISGGPGNDRMLGGAGHDQMSGDAGHDYFNGNSGDDVLLGGSGNDRMNGARGNDQLEGGLDNDRMLGGAGRDVMKGGDGNDYARGHGSSDTISGGPGDDRLYGDAGNDRIDGDSGDDRLRGGDGKDVLTGGDGDDVLRGGDNDDQLAGGAGLDLIVGDSGDDLLNGNAGDDTMFGNGGDDVLAGGSGRDILRGDGGTDQLNGQEDGDMLIGSMDEDQIIGFDPSSDTIDATFTDFASWTE